MSHFDVEFDSAKKEDDEWKPDKLKNVLEKDQSEKGEIISQFVNASHSNYFRFQTDKYYTIKI